MSSRYPTKNTAKRPFSTSYFGHWEVDVKDMVQNKLKDKYKYNADLKRAFGVVESNQTQMHTRTSAARSTISPTRRSLRENSGNEIMANSALASPPTFTPVLPAWGVDDESGREMQQPEPLASSAMNSPVSPGFHPFLASGLSTAGDNSDEITWTQSAEQSNSSDTIEDEYEPEPFSQWVESPVRQHPPTPTINSRSPDEIRLEDIFRVANSTLSQNIFARSHTLQTHIQWGQQLTDFFTFKSVVQNVRDILIHVKPEEHTANFGDGIRDPDISPEIYRLLSGATHNNAITPPSQFMEAFNLWEISQYFANEIAHRRYQYSTDTRGRTDLATGEILLEFEHASSGLNMHALLDMREANEPRFSSIMKPIHKLWKDSTVIQHYVQAMETPAALLIWPWEKSQQVTKLSLHQHDLFFVCVMARFIRGIRGSPDVGGLLNNLSVWINGWATGAIPSNLALDYIDSFVDIGHKNCMISPNENLSALLNHQRRHEADSIMSQIRARLRGYLDLGDPTNSVIGSQWHQLRFATEDLETLKPGYQLRPDTVAAITVTSDLPTNVIVAPPLSYNHYYNRRSVLGPVMSIDPHTTTILCTVYFLPLNGRCGPNILPPCGWIGVVVRLRRDRPPQPAVSLELLDSGLDTAYDPLVVQEMILDWLRTRLPNFESFEVYNSIRRAWVYEHSAITESGVHTIANLALASRSSNYRLNLTGEWANAQRKRYLIQILRSASRNLRGKSGQVYTEIDILGIIDELEECEQWGLKARRQRLGQFMHNFRS